MEQQQQQQYQQQPQQYQQQAQPQPVPQGQPQHVVQSESSKDIQRWTDTINERMKNTDPLMNPQGTSEWSHGFFDCFNPIDTCLITCCCPCITFGKTHHRIHKGDLSTWSPLNASCLGWYVASIFGCHCIPNMLQRTDIREKSSPKLRGDGVVDFLKAWCCSCCDLIQQDKESERLLQQTSLVTEQPLKNPAGMQYPAA